jgi:DNA-directed RNA polymerase subunit F
MERNKKRITVVLEPKTDRVALSSFRTAIDQLTILLNEVASEISEPKPRHVSWCIAELSLDSPAKISVESIEEETEAIAVHTASVVIEGFIKLQKERVRPKYFNDNALESAQRMARLTADNLARINVYSDIPDHQVYLSEQIAVNIADILEYLDYYGSVEGRLELISGREGQPLYFRVQDRVNNVGVRCIIPDELLENALDAFRKRVIVYGIIKSDSSGIPRNIRVESIEIVPGEESLPQAEELVQQLKEHPFGIQPYGQQP